MSQHCEFMCLQESSSEFEVVNMEEKALSETQQVSFGDVRKSWAAAVTQLARVITCVYFSRLLLCFKHSVFCHSVQRTLVM